MTLDPVCGSNVASIHRVGRPAPDPSSRPGSATGCGDDPPGTVAYQNFTGGGYFFLDQSDRLWIPTKTDHIFVLDESQDGKSLVKQRDYDLTGVLNSADERITSVLADFSGLLWFVSKKNGKVGLLNPKTRAVHVLRLGEEVENSFAVDRGSAYVVSDKKMYRLNVDPGGHPHIVWQVRYRNSGIVKPSQVDAGSGTTPTVMKGGTSRSPTTPAP